MKHSLLKAKMAMLEIGIVPAITARDLSLMLESLSPSDRRIAKRKFRKQWRKLLKNKPDLKSILKPEKGCLPDNNHMRARCVFIISDIIKKID